MYNPGATHLSENTMETIRYAIYARKSQTSEDRQVQSIESQSDVLREIGLQYGLRIVATFTDSQTAHKPYVRQGFQLLLQAIAEGKVDGILVWKADRLARNQLEGGQLMHLLQTGPIKEIRTPYNRYLPTDNVLPLNIEFGMANQYSIDLSRNVKRGNKTKIEKGGICGPAPHGYKNNKLNKTVEVDEDHFPWVRKMWDLMLTGNYSVPQVCKIADHEWKYRTVRKERIGGRRMAVSSLYGIFSNTFYYGQVHNGENVGVGNHIPMVTKAEFEQVQQILRRAGHFGEVTHSFPYGGFMDCGECGAKITAEEKVKYSCPGCHKQQSAKHPRRCICGYEVKEEDIAQGHWYTYYRCTKRRGPCSQKCVRSEDMERQVRAHIASLQLDARVEAWTMKWLRVMVRERLESKKYEQEAIQRRIQGLDEKLRRLIDMRASGEIEQDEFMEMKQKIKDEKEAVKGLHDQQESNQEEWLQEVALELSLSTRLLDRFDEADNREKKEILLTVGSNFTLIDGKLSLEPKKQYLRFRKLQDVAPISFEPPSDVLKTAQETLAATTNSEWYTVLEEIRTLYIHN